MDKTNLLLFLQLFLQSQTLSLFGFKARAPFCVFGSANRTTLFALVSGDGDVNRDRNGDGDGVDMGTV